MNPPSERARNTFCSPKILHQQIQRLIVLTQSQELGGRGGHLLTVFFEVVSVREFGGTGIQHFNAVLVAVAAEF